MVSAWWLLMAFWLGGCLGMLLAGLLAVSRKSSEFDAEQEASMTGTHKPIHRRF